ncbi:MAG TPA: substrate-binding domain-containing protein, partial [Acidimicrobiales bacterium]|nr:substrate-binding domain-containing protein [Acidimicrobiales bacterium]
MQSIKKRRLAWLSIILAFSLTAAACGDDDDDASTSDGGDSGSDSGNVSGSINISGSSTVEPITSLAAESFTGENSDVDIAVDGPGTGDGFELFCNGETDISDASRTIEDEEAAACETNGVEYVELQIGYDGMSVLTSSNNDGAPECLSFADLYALIGPESEGFDNWSDAQALATELGSSTQFPDAPLELTGPGTESGTYDSFIELALADIAGERGQADDTTRTDYASSADDNVIIQNIEASDTSLGWVGFAFAE